MKTIKCGLMPGRLQQIEVSENTTARELFEKAGIELANHEIRLDGEKIDLDTIIYNGSLCVGLKMIKGNSDVYVTDCTDEEIVMLLGVALPREISEENISTCGENFLEVKVDGELLIVEEDMFNSVYNIKTECDTLFEYKTEEVEKTCNCTHNNAIEVIENEINELKKSYDFYTNQAIEVNSKISLLKDLLNKINK